MAVLLCSVFVLLYVCNVQSLSKTCEHKGRNYAKCDLIFWTAWTVCKGGNGWKPTECAVGFEKRQKKICCPRKTLNDTTDETFRHCKANCNVTDDDFEEVRRLPTSGTTDLIIAGIAASGAMALLAICCLVFGLLYKRQKRKTEVKPEGERNEVSAT